MGAGWHKISRRRGRPINLSSSQKTRLNDLSYGIKIWTDFSSVLSQFTRLTDGRTDGQTDRIVITRPRLHSMQHDKNDIVVENWNHCSKLSDSPLVGNMRSRLIVLVIIITIKVLQNFSLIKVKHVTIVWVVKVAVIWGIIWASSRNRFCFQQHQTFHKNNVNL